MLPEKAPIVEINSTNVDQLWPCLLLAIRSSTFVAIDAEFSGIGCRKSLQAKDIEERYKSIAEVARTRSVLSLGLSCFKYRGEREPGRRGENEDRVFLVQTFNIVTLCSDGYLVEPSCLQFLVEHGFDFNRQYSVGVKYHRGMKDEDILKKENPKKNSTGKKGGSDRGAFRPHMRLLVEEIVASGVPIVLHNALIDLIFLYGNFYGCLPSGLATFVSDLSSMFPGGVFDTKVVAEFKMRMQVSFLEYVYKKSLKENKKLAKREKSSVVVEFLKFPSGVEKHLAWVELSSSQEEEEEEKNDDGTGLRVLCRSFSNHGWCIDGVHCKNSHSVDLVIKNESNNNNNNKNNSNSKSKNKNQKSKEKVHARQEEERMEQEEEEAKPVKRSRTDRESAELDGARVESSPPDPRVSKDGTHRAGFDAFMTGLAFSVFLTKHCRESPSGDSGFAPEGRWSSSSWGSIPADFGNKIYLSGKDFPLQISQSTFSKPSRSNLEKLERLRKKD